MAVYGCDTAAPLPLAAAEGKQPEAPQRECDRRSKVFFSGEKKQKTFVFAQLAVGWPWPGIRRSTRTKSLLVLFFRKEHLPFVLHGMLRE
jgi:hypothetical protein